MNRSEKLRPVLFVRLVRMLGQQVKDDTAPEAIVGLFTEWLWACFGRDRMRAMLKQAMDQDWPSERERETSAMVGVYEAHAEMGNPEPMARAKRLFALRDDDRERERVESRIRKARARKGGVVSS